MKKIGIKRSLRRDEITWIEDSARPGVPKLYTKEEAEFAFPRISKARNSDVAGVLIVSVDATPEEIERWNRRVD